MIEIERKFLVTSNDFINESKVHFEIAQGYISTNPDRTVRVRVKGDNGYLTIKGKGNESGMSRFEWEKEISLEDAKNLLQLCEKGVIHKTRYNINKGKHIFEVDVFHGENDKLIIAEIELQNEQEFFEKPKWLGEEVTNNEKYYNAFLSQNPFKKW